MVRTNALSSTTDCIIVNRFGVPWLLQRVLVLLLYYLGGWVLLGERDGDEIALFAEAGGEGYRIGFGPCTGTVLPARP